MDQDATTVLLACLNYGNAAAKSEQLARVSAEEWRMVVELAQEHNVAPLLYHRLQQARITLPDDITKKLAQALRKSALRMMRLYEELNKLLRLLQKKEIQVIALKGAYLAEVVYEHIGLRAMRDIDLLAKKDDLPRVDQGLLALGYVPEESNRVVTQETHHFGYLLPASGLRVEIHWTILDANFPLQIDVEGLWNRAQPVTLSQVPALALSPEDLLLHLCLHTVFHAYEIRVAYEMRLRMLCDIGEVVRRFGAELDWQGMGARARQWRAVRAVYVVLRLAQELLGAAVPGDWLVSLRPDSFSERYLDLAREQILIERNDVKAALLGSNYLPQLWGSKGLGSKLALIRDRLLPPPEVMALKYPAPANSWRIYLYYPVRLKDVLVRRGATFWRLARGDPKTRSVADQTNQVMELRDWLMSG